MFAQPEGTDDAHVSSPHHRGDAGGRACCIGLVEDEALVRRAWGETLQAGGYSVLEAADGNEMLGRLESEVPSLIVLDMLMPKIDGFEFLARLRSDTRWGRIPVLIVSELADALIHAVDPQSARDLDIVGILPKSVMPQDLLDAVAIHVPERGRDSNANARESVP